VIAQDAAIALVGAGAVSQEVATMSGQQYVMLVFQTRALEAQAASNELAATDD
jgi:hypothetical protein